MYIFFLIKKNTVENPKFNFLTKICEIQKKHKFAKFFVSVRSTNFVDIMYIFHLFSNNTIKIQKFHYLNKICDIRKNVEVENYLLK